MLDLVQDKLTKKLLLKQSKLICYNTGPFFRNSVRVFGSTPAQFNDDFVVSLEPNPPLNIVAIPQRIRFCPFSFKLFPRLQAGYFLLLCNKVIQYLVMKVGLIPKSTMGTMKAIRLPTYPPSQTSTQRKKFPTS